MVDEVATDVPRQKNAASPSITPTVGLWEEEDHRELDHVSLALRGEKRRSILQKKRQFPSQKRRFHKNTASAPNETIQEQMLL